MTIFKQEFKNYIRPLIVWCFSLLTIHIVASIEFNVFQSTPDFSDLLSEYGDLFNALGGGTTDITTPQGFLSMLSIYLVLPLAIYSGLLGSTIISKEEKDKTAEFLFTLPITRKRVLLNKLGIAIVNSLILNLFLMGAITLIYSTFNPGADFYIFMIQTSSGAFMTQLMFLSIGAGLSSVLKHYKKSGNVTIAILVSSFMLSILIGFVEEVEFLKYVSPYNYFNPGTILNGNFELIFVFLSLLIIGSGLGTLFIYYPKRDLYI